MSRSPFHVRFQTENAGPTLSWLFITPGLLLILLAIGILIWPELLAYIVAAALLMMGLTLVGWGWRMRHIKRRYIDHDDITI